MRKLITRIFNKIILHFNHRSFVKQWILGVAREDIREIIRNKNFDFTIKWLPIKKLNRQYADPFILNKDNDTYTLLIEDCVSEDQYGKIALMIIDANFRIVEHEIILDTQSHLSYPFIFRENEKVYVFPESAKNGKLSCYEYDYDKKKLIFLKDVIELPLLDSNVIKYRNKYWVFATTRDAVNKEDYELRCFFSEKLLGPYIPHPGNPLKSGLDGVRGAGMFIEVDGSLYRPAQNCREDYGKSITINKINRFDEVSFEEEIFMTVSINPKKKYNRGMHAIHTINVKDDLIILDGRKWTFSPIKQYRKLALEKANLDKINGQKE